VLPSVLFRKLDPHGSVKEIIDIQPQVGVIIIPIPSNISTPLSPGDPVLSLLPVSRPMFMPSLLIRSCPYYDSSASLAGYVPGFFARISKIETPELAIL
jgi:hypothetical protein